MYYLSGFTEYKKENHPKSVFKTAMISAGPWCFHFLDRAPLTGRIIKNDVYNIVIDAEEIGEYATKKIFVNFLYPEDLKEKILPLIKKVDKKIKNKKLAPTENFRERRFVKNKTLYPLMKEKELVFFTLLDGQIIRGLIQCFSMFDITVSMKGGVPLTFLRHSIYDVRNKAGRCFLKSFQQKAQDWKKSPLYVNNE